MPHRSAAAEEWTTDNTDSTDKKFQIVSVPIRVIRGSYTAEAKAGELYFGRSSEVG